MQHSIVTRLISAVMLILLVAFCAADCKKVAPDTPDNPNTPENPDTPDTPDNPDNPEADYFKLVSLQDSSKEAETFYLTSYNPVILTIVVKTNLKADKVSLKSDAPWCTPAYDGSTLKLNLSQYGEQGDILQPRSCSIEVTAGSVYHNTLTVVQQSQQIRLGTFTYRNRFNLPANGEPLYISINTNLWDWQIRNENDWITAEHVDRLTLKVAAKPRSGGQDEKRDGKIYLYSISEKSFDIYTEASAYQLYFFDSDPAINGDGYDYGDHTDWD